MTRSVSAVSFALATLIVTAFALPVYADRGTYHDRWYDDRDHDRTRIPSCEISARPNTTGYGGHVTLSWEADYADYVVITDLGQMSPEGSQRITVFDSKTYYMTAYNDGKTSECSTIVNIPGDRSGGYPYYTYPTYSYPTYTYPTSYITLTQIPYTGFDFGPVGNAMYWFALMALAVGAAYLLVYQSGLYALASVSIVGDTVRAGKMQYATMRSAASTLFMQKRVKKASPALAMSRPVVEQTLVATQTGNDTMKVIEGDQPRIVITRE